MLMLQMATLGAFLVVIRLGGHGSCGGGVAVGSNAHAP